MLLCFDRASLTFPYVIPTDDPYFPGLRVRVPGLRGGSERHESLLSSETDSPYSLDVQGHRGRERRRASSRCRDSLTEQSLYGAGPPPSSRHGRHRSRRRSQSREHAGFPMVFPVARDLSPAGSGSASPVRRTPLSPSHGRPFSPAEVYSFSMSLSQQPLERESSSARRKGRRHSRERPHSPLGPRGSKTFSPERKVALRSAREDVEGGYVANRAPPLSPTGAEHRVEEMRERFEGVQLNRGRHNRRGEAAEK